MRAVAISAPGGPEVLRLAERPDPQPGPEEVLVRIRATAVNRADLLQRRGRYPAPPGVIADVPGLEFAGEVAACGPRAFDLRPGDRVMGLLGGGGYAEAAAVHERMCLRIPPALSFEEAAAVPEAFLTAHDALVAQGGMGPGEAVLVHAAGSGVGTAAVQLASACGARALALSRTAAKRQRLPALGAVHVLDPGAPDAARLVLQAAGGEGVDLALDLVGAPALPMNLEVLAPRGRLVLVGTLGGARVEIDLGLLLRRRIRVTGTVLRSRPLEEKIAATRAFARQVLPLLASGRLRPVIDRVLPLAEAARAHALLESDATFGKVVLRV